MWSTDPETVSEKEGTKGGTAPAGTPHGTGDEKKEAPGAEGSSAPAELLVCDGAKCTCDKAVDPSPKTLKVLSHHKYVINDNGESKLLATNKENALPNLNFGQCKVPDPNHPVPCTAKLQWKDYYDHVELPEGAYVLTEKSTAKCTAKGGSIKIVQHGQQANITTQEVEKANTGAWAAEGPLLTEEIIKTEQAANNSDVDGANVKSVEPVLYHTDQPLNTPIEFKANFTGNPTAAEKQGVNWIIYDEKGQPIQLRTDVGEKITVTFKQAGTYMIEAYGKKAGDKKVTKPFHIKTNEIDTVTTVDGSLKVRIAEPVEFRLKTLFQGIALPGNTETISWTVTKNKGLGTPVLLNQTGPSTQVVCNEEASYVVTAYFNGVAKQSKVIEALKNGIASVSASTTSARVKESIKFTVKDQFKILPARETEKALVKWQCTDTAGKLVAAFSSKTGESIDYVFDQPGEYTVQPFMVKASSKIAVKVVIAQPTLLSAQWEYPEGRVKDKTGWNELNHAAMVFQAAEGLIFDLEYGYLTKDNKPKPLHVITGLKIPKSQVVDLKGCDFNTSRSKYSKELKEGDLFYFKVNCQSKGYEIVNASALQPQKKLQLVTGEQIVSIEFLKAGKPVMSAEYGDQMQCRIRTRNLTATKIRVKICRQESRMGLDLLREDTPVLDKVYPVPEGGVVLFDFTLDKSWEKSYSEKLHSFYAVIDEMESGGITSKVMVFKNGVPANGGKAMAGVEKIVSEKGVDSDCPRCNLPITLAQMKSVFPDGNDKNLSDACDTFNKYMKEMGMNTCWNKAHFLAQASIEVGRSFKIKKPESYDYYAPKLPIRFKAFRTPEGREKAKEWGRKVEFSYQPGYVAVSQETQVKIANWAYSPNSEKGKEIGNKYPDDGYKFIGKGLIQLTGRGNYAMANIVTLKYLKVNILDDPDQVFKNTAVAVLSSMAYWVNRNLQNISNGQVDEGVISKKIGTDVDWAGKKKSFDNNTSKLLLTDQCQFKKKKSTNNEDLKIPAGVSWLQTISIDQSEVETSDYIVPYVQDNDRVSEAGTKTMDCSEMVCRFLQKIEWSEEVMALNTSGLYAFAKKHPEWLEKHDDLSYFPKAGDIFIWASSKGTNGHTGVVIGFNEKTDIVTTIEAVSTFEKPEGEKNKLLIKGVTKLKWKRKGAHLMGHKTETKTYTATTCRFYTPKVHYSKENKK